MDISYTFTSTFFQKLFVICIITVLSVTRLFAQVPTISNFSPTSGPIGTSVTITGTNFDATAANNIVFFGATRATVTAATITSLTVTVPAGAAYQPISVLNVSTAKIGYSVAPFATTFAPTKYSIATTDFSGNVDFTAGTIPVYVAIGDLDGDGKPDLAVINKNDNTVSVWRNTSTTGTITFSSKVDFATGTTPTSVAIGDLDGDGKRDLTITNSGSNTVSVLRNTATSGTITAGSFAAKVDFATGSSPTNVAIGDLDGDGKRDLAVTNSGSNTVSVLRNTATSGTITTGSFAGKVDFTTGTTPNSVAIGDLDGDSKPDLAITNSGSASVSIFLNTSTSGAITTSSFSGKVDFATGTIPNSVAIGDLDGDSKPDLAVANSGSASVSVFLNTSTSGSIAFATQANFTTGTTPFSVAIGDLDGDGKPDLAVANSGSNTVSVLRNTSTSGSITFASKVDFTTGTTPNSVAIGDIDGNGKSELAVINAGSASISVLRNTSTSGTISFATKVDFQTGSQNPVGVAIGDLDGDGKSDIVVANNSGNKISIFLNASSSGVAFTATSFVAQPILTTLLGPTSIAIGDLDGDGKPDLAVTNSSVNSISVWRNISTSGSISFATRADFLTAVGTRTTSIAIGDLDGDGKPDLAVTNNKTTLPVSNQVSVFRNIISISGSITSASFATRFDYITGTISNSANSVAIGDLDGDGKRDLAVANSGSNTVSVLRNMSTSGVAFTGTSFDNRFDYTTGTGSSPNCVVIGDLDGDDKLDLAVANGANATVSVLRNMATSGVAFSAASFVAQATLSTDNTPNSVAIGDLDGDGKPDLAVANRGALKTVSVFRNLSTSLSNTISFNTKTTLSLAFTLSSLAIGDLDGDGKPDLAATNYTSFAPLTSWVSVFRNAPVYTPSTNITFTNTANVTTTATTTVSWTNGNGAFRAVFMALANTGNPLPVDGTTYTAHTIFGSGTQIGTSGWFCIYNGTGTTVDITNLTQGTTYRVMVVDYYKGTSTETESYLTTTAAGNPANLPITATTGSLTALNTTYGTASSSSTFSVSGTDMTAGILVSPPTGFEVSLDNTTFTPSVTVGAAGTIASTPVYIRLSSLTAAGTYSGDVVLSSSGAASINVATVSSTVSPAALIITAAIANKTYGTTITGAAGSTAFTSTGLQNSETIGSITIAYGTGSAATAAVGTYTGSVTPSTATGGTFNTANYNIIYNTGDIVIGQANLTITATGPTKTYGTALATGTNTTDFTAGATVNGEIVTSVTLTPDAAGLSATTAAAAGYTVTPSLATGDSGFSESNYNITYQSFSGTVSKAALTITATGPAKTYGTALIAGTSTTDFTAGATVNGETVTSVTLTPDAPGLSATTAAGVSYIVTPSLATGDSGFLESNYNIIYQPFNGTVNKAALTIATNNATKVYSVVNPTLGVTYTGFVNGDSNTSLTIQPTVATTAVTDSAVGTYPITASGAASANYSISYVAGTLTVTQATLTIAANHAAKVYGAANPTLGVTYTGFVNGDTNTSLTTQPTVTTTAVTGSAVGTYPITASSATSANYTINYIAGALTVTQATLTIAANNATKVYATVNPALGVTYTGFVNGDSNTSLTTQPTVTTTAVTGSAVGAYQITASGAASANYSISYTAGALTVTRAILTITANNAIKVYGTVNPPLSVTYTGFVNGDANTNLTTQPTVTTTAVTGSPVGPYPITASGAASPNYTISYVAGTLTVTPLTNASLANLVISSGTLSPTFAQATTTYTASVANAVTSVRLTPTTADPTATVKVNGVSIASGSASGSIPLVVGPNVINTVVTAQDGTTVITYTTTVTRAPSSIASLANLTISNGTLKPAFAPATYIYTTSVDNTLSKFALTPTLADATATILINGQPAANAAQSGLINLLQGDNTITILTIAQDGFTRFTYTLTVYRPRALLAVKANNILSPNGDGNNDVWVVEDIESYPNNKVTIFDKAGRVVYTTNSYSNDWTGTYQGSPLEEGTYYYAIDFGKGNGLMKGYITIIR
jgi:gliding motility-associated-like protein